MTYLVILCASSLGIVPVGGASILSNPLSAYQSVRDQVGADADAHVRLALWCEANGLTTERLEQLNLALSVDPSHPNARGLLGQIDVMGRWQRAEDVRADETPAALLAEYNTRRSDTPNTADGHWKLALWCERAGLKPEAAAHLAAVTRLAPGRTEAWLRLGCRRYNGRWLNESEIAAARAESNAQQEADRHWAPRLREWWTKWLADKDRRAEAEESLARTLSPRAVPSIRRLFGAGTPEQQLLAVRLLGRIDAPEASTELARLAGQGRSEEVHLGATKALARRDPREFFDVLLGLLRAPIQVELSSSGGAAGAVASLRVEDERLILRKLYLERLVPVTPSPRPELSLAWIAPAFSKRPPATARQQLGRDLRLVRADNERRAAMNAAVLSTLTTLTGNDLGPDPEAWKKWWTDQKGYVYSPPSTVKPTVNRTYAHDQQVTISPQVSTHHSCFGEGTPVMTILGRKTIETVSVGDRILVEDVRSGALSFQPVVAVYHNPPSPTLSLRLGAEPIVTTPIHRFWKAGKGWVMARDLTVGDNLRTLGGLVQVTAVTTADFQPVFNLEVSVGHSFFVGRSAALVHDHSLVRPTPEPFDRPLVLEAITNREPSALRAEGTPGR